MQLRSFVGFLQCCDKLRDQFGVPPSLVLGLFEGFAFADVRGDPDVSDVVAGPIEARLAPRLHVPPFAVGAFDADFGFEVTSLLDTGGERLGVVGVIGMGEQRPVLVEHLVAVDAEVLREREVDPLLGAVRPVDPHRQRQRVREESEPVLARAQFQLGARPFDR